MSLFIDAEEVPRIDLQGLVSESYNTFRSADVTPVKQVGGASISSCSNVIT